MRLSAASAVLSLAILFGCAFGPSGSAACRDPATAAECGFHLRSAFRLPGSIEVRATSHALRDALRARLAAGREAPAGDPPDFVLDVSEERFTARTLSVDPATGAPREEEIAFHLRYALRDRGDGTVLASGEIRLKRDYRLDPSRLRSQRRERALVEREMQRDAANTVVHRLHAARRSATGPG